MSRWRRVSFRVLAMRRCRIKTSFQEENCDPIVRSSTYPTLAISIGKSLPFISTLRDQHRPDRETQPGVSPACGRARTAGEYAMQTRSGTASAADALPCIPQLCVASRQLALASGRSDGRDGIRQALEVTDASDGSGTDKSGLEFERGADVPCAPVATTSCVVGTWRDRGEWRSAGAVYPLTGTSRGVRR
jgi:hypothetical protein